MSQQDTTAAQMRPGAPVTMRRTAPTSMTLSDSVYERLLQQETSFSGPSSSGPSSNEPSSSETGLSSTA